MRKYLERIANGNDPFSGIPDPKTKGFLEHIRNDFKSNLRGGTTEEIIERGQRWRRSGLEEQLNDVGKRLEKAIASGASPTEIANLQKRLGALNETVSGLRAVDPALAGKMTRGMSRAKALLSKVPRAGAIGGGLLFVITWDSEVEAHGLALGTARALPIVGDFVTIGMDSKQIADDWAAIRAAGDVQGESQRINSVRMELKTNQLLTDGWKKYADWEYGTPGTINADPSGILKALLHNYRAQLRSAVREFKRNDGVWDFEIDAEAVRKVNEKLELQLRQHNFHPAEGNGPLS